MLLSREAEYAIQAMLKLTNYDRDYYVPINVLAADLNISFYYLSKILQKLVKCGFLYSHKGPRGGISFAVDPKKATIMDIILEIDGDKIFRSCVMGFHKCDDENKCPLHHQWKQVSENLKNLFAQESLVELGKDPEIIKRSMELARGMVNSL